MSRQLWIFSKILKLSPYSSKFSPEKCLVHILVEQEQRNADAAFFKKIPELYADQAINGWAIQPWKWEECGLRVRGFCSILAHKKCSKRRCFHLYIFSELLRISKILALNFLYLTRTENCPYGAMSDIIVVHLYGVLIYRNARPNLSSFSCYVQHFT